LLYEPWEGDNAVVLLATACPGPDRPEFAAATVLHAVLGQGEGSRLFRALRDRLGLTYSIVSDVSPSRLCGMMAISVSCEPKQTAEVFRIMQSEVAALKVHPPTEDEVQRARAYLTSSYILGHQRNAEVAHYLGLFEVLSPGRHEGDLAAMVAAVTPAEVCRAAGWLTDRNVWVQVGGRRP
jgi:zinc protease